MPGGRTSMWKLATLLALGCAGGVAASAAKPVEQAWSADPESQFLLDVSVRQVRIGEGVRAYNTPEGTCVLFGDFVSTLEVPIKIDLASKRASGWAFKEDNRIAIDLAAMTARFGGKTEAIGRDTVRETPEGWCVDSAALGRWFGMTVRPVTAGSALLLESEAKLPVELAVERQRRAEQLRPRQFDLSDLPQVRLPYRMWRTPALDFVVSAGVTYRANDGVKVDRRSSVLAAGEVAHLSYEAQFGTDARGKPHSLRLRAYRSDPDGGLLGPLRATHLGVGDVLGFDTRLTGTGTGGRGGLVTNRPVAAPAAFDRTRFEGELPPGWDAEIYRNDELLAFAKRDSSQRYVFEDVQLLYGENRIRIVLYGPQGQIRTREELINVGQENVPAGKTWYWAGFNQPGRDLASFTDNERHPLLPKAQAAVSVEHGLDERTSVGALARAMLIDDERLTFIEGTVRRSIGTALVEAGAARDANGGHALRAQMLAKFGKVNVSAEALAANDFQLRGRRETGLRDIRVGIDAPLRIGQTVVPAHGDVRITDRKDGSTELEAAARLSASLRRFNLATDLRYRRQYASSGPSPPAELNLDLIGAGRAGDVRLRGYTSFDLGKRSLRSAELSAYWSASESSDWEGALAYDTNAKRGRARMSHIRRLNSVAVAVTGEAASDGSMAVGLNLNFSLDARRGLRFSRQPLAGAGAVDARVYRDLNDNGLRDPSEPFEKGALITAGRRVSDKPTDSGGSVMIGGLATFSPVTVGVDETSLPDPTLVPRKALQVVVPRPGVPAEVHIGLVGGGDIEGALLKNGGLGFEGLDLQLVDAAGKVIGTTRTDFDGFFLFERVAYGQYSLRLSAESAEAAGVGQHLSVQAVVSSDKPVVRLGGIQVQPPPRIASVQ